MVPNSSKEKHELRRFLLAVLTNIPPKPNKYYCNANPSLHVVLFVSSQSEMLGCIKLAIDNIAEKCQRLRGTPVEKLDVDSKLKLIQVGVNFVSVEKYKLTSLS